MAVKVAALQRAVGDKNLPLFYTYSDFHARFGFRGMINSWANRKVLDPAAAWFVSNDLLDLTFLIHRKDTGYPSVIDGKDSREPTPQQKNRAREEAQRIINEYRPGTVNPY
jgi:hypothetical protein